MNRSFVPRVAALVLACLVYAVIALPVLSHAARVMA